MKVKDLIKTLEQYPEIWVKVAELKKHEDNAPTMGVVMIEKTKLQESDEEVFLLWIEPNPDTIIKPVNYPMSSEDYLV